jgi:hypothetical protein
VPSGAGDEVGRSAVCGMLRSGLQAERSRMAYPFSSWALFAGCNTACRVPGFDFTAIVTRICR